MKDLFGQFVLGQLCDVGWDSLVKSMRGAIEDRSHVVNIGYAAAFVVIVWINWRIAKWILRHFQTADHRS